MKEVLDYKMPRSLKHIKSRYAARILFFAGILCLPVILKAQVECVSGISITPAIQTICRNSIPTTLSASLTITPNTAPGTITYQWYSNTANSTSGGTLVKTTSTTTATTSDTYIPVTTTSGTIYYYCVVTNDASCSTPTFTTTTSRVVVQTPPALNNPTASPSGAICEGTNVSFTAASLSGTYQWKVNGSNVGTNSRFYNSATLGNGDIVSVEFISSTSCTTPVTKQLTMIVNDVVVPQVTIDASSDNLCPGSPAIFTASPVNGGTSPVYQWKVNGLNVGTGGNTYNTSTLLDGDVVTVGMTSNAVCAAPVSVTSNSIPVTVNPNLPVSVSIAASTSIICAGSSVTFTATPVNQGSSPDYQWKVNGVNTGTNSPIFTTTSLANNDVVTVELISSITPCATGNPATSNAINMVVNPLLPVSVSIAASNTTICPGNAVTFTATPVNPGSNPSYQWKVNGINAGTNSTSFTSASLSNNDVVTVVLTSNATPCATGNPATSNSIPITVNPELPVSVGISASATSICSGTPVTFSATPVNGGSSPVFQWKVNGVNAGTNSSTFTTSSLFNNDVVSVIVTSNATPCATGNPAPSNNLVMTVTPSPSPSFTTSPAASVCTGSNVSYTTQAGQSNYNWSLPGSPGTDYNIISGGTGTSNNTVTVAWLTPGSKTVTVNYNNAGGCPGIIAASSIITVNQTLAPSVSISAPTISVCSTTPLTFTAVPVNGGTTPTYQWRLNGTVISGATGATYTRSTWASGNAISVTMTSNYACSSPVSATSISTAMLVSTSAPASIAANSVTGPASICPPVSDIVYTVTPVLRAETYNWVLPTGFTITSGEGTNTITVSVSNAASIANNQNITVNASNGCGSGSGRTLNVNVNNFAGIDAGADRNVCAGTAITLAGAWSGNTSASTWTASSGSFSNPSLPTSTYTPSITSGTVILTLTTSDPAGSCPAATDQMVVTVNQPAAITSQPVSQTTCSGSTVTLNVATTGTGLTYQWRKSSTLLVDGANIPVPILPRSHFQMFTTATAGSYSVIVYGVSPCASVTSSTANLIVNSAVSISTQPAVSKNACAGGSVFYSVTASGTGLTYRWRKGSTPLVDGGNISGANSATLTINPVNFSDAASDYNVVISGTAPCSPVTSDNSALVVNEPVNITSHPDPQTICSGTSANFTVEATGSGLTYQWKRNGVNISNSANITGATSSTLTILSASSVNAGTYTVAISGILPCTAVTSDPATLVVNQPAIITTQPIVTKNICSGNSTTLSVVASGTGLTYQWRKGTTNLTDNGNISGTNTATLTFNPVLVDDEASDYNVVVSASSPCNTVTSNNAEILVKEAVNITSQPVSQAACSGNTVTLSVGATGDGLTYQWRKNGSVLSNSATVTGVATSTLTLSNVTTASSGNYTVLVSGIAPCAAVTSATAILTVSQAVAITTQPANISVCGSFAVDFTVVATGTGLSYQWYKSPGIPVVNTSNISGATTNNLHFSQGNIPDNGNYYVVVSGTAPCPSVTSLTKTLDVNEAINITTQPVASQTICEGLSATFEAEGSASDPLDYQWRKNGVIIPGANASSFSISTLTVADAGNYDVVISGPPGYTCSVVYSSPSALVVTPTVGIPVFTTGTSSACEDGANETYTATATNSTSISYSISPSSAGTINPATGVVDWDAAFTGNVTITATATGCNGPSTSSKSVTVNPKPVVSSASAGIICSGIAQNYTITSNLGGASFLWSRAAVPGISNAAANAQTGNPIIESLINTSGSPENVVYTITPIVSGCSGNTFNYTVTVNPLPTASISGTASVCINSTSPLITFTGSGGTTPYTFTYKINGGSDQTISTISGSSVTLGVPTGTVGPITYSLVSIIDGSPNACTKPQAGSATVTVLPDATISRTSALATISQSVCVNTAISPINYTIGGGATGATFSGLPAGITTTVSGNNVTLSGTPVAPGTFSYTVQTTGTCTQVSSTGTITVNAVPAGGTTSSSSNLFVCAGVNAGAVTVSGHTGSVSKWQSSVNGGLTWTDINSTSTSIIYTNLNQTTWYRAVIIQPTCPGLLTYSAHTIVNVVPITASISGLASPAVICSGSSTLTASASGSSSTVGVLEGGSFDQAGSPLEGAGLWRAHERGTHHNIEGSANNGTNPFNLTNGPKEFFGPPSYAPNPYTVTYNNNPLGGQVNNNKFMVANGLVDCTLETPIFNLIGLSRASIDWFEAYILQPGATIKMEISTDGGNTYNTFLRPDIVGPVSYASPTDFAKTSVDLSAYAGLSNLRVRFTYTSTTYSSWGLEMATITKGTTTPAYTWNLYEPAPVTGTPPAHYLNEFVNNSVTVTPPSPNNTNAPITYYYSLASSEGGCASNVTVTVNPTPRISHSPVSPVCSGTPLSPNITFSSTIPGTTYSYNIINPGGITGLVTNANGTISGTPVNPMTVSQTIRFIATAITPYCPGIPDTVDIIVNPITTITISGNQTVCGAGSSAIITLTSPGPFPFSALLSNGISYTLNSSPLNITVNPTATTTYSILSLTGACLSGSGTTGSATVNVISNAGITGTWFCTTGDGDWFNPCNWANNIVPDTSINVIIATISSSCNPVIDPFSPFASQYGPVAKSKNITISGTRNLSFANSGELQVAGNWLNNVGPAGFTANTGTVSMIGGVEQTITTTPGSTETFYNLRVNNRSAVTQGVTLNSNVNVTNTLTLTRGIVNTHSNPPASAPNTLGLLTMTTTANPVAGSPGVNSFINGQMAREFNNSGVASEYAYPIGKVISGLPVYKDMAVQPTTTSAITTFTSEYFPTTHPGPSVLLAPGMVGFVPEYWQVDQGGGTAAAKVKIPYLNPGSGSWLGSDNAPVPNPCTVCNVAVVRKDVNTNGWNFTNTAGNFSSVGPEYRHYLDNGYIYSASNISFGPFTSGFAYNVILPVTLLSFDAKLSNGNGLVSWKIEQDKDLDHFELQHSQSGDKFLTIGSINSNAGALKYDFIHRNLDGGSHFYRLLVKEKSGKEFYSKTVLLKVPVSVTRILGVNPNPARNETFLSVYSVKSQTVQVRVSDVTGRLVSSTKILISAGENKNSFSTALLPPGVYNFNITTEDGVLANLRIVKE